MKKYVFLFLTFTLGILNAQDAYHADLITFLQTDYQLEAPEFLLDDTEIENLNSMYVYGAASRSTSEVTDFDFTQMASFNVSTVGNNAWDSGAGFKTKSSISKDDILLITFWAKKTSNESEVFIFAEDGTTFEKDFYETVSFTPDWNRYFIAIKASKAYGADGMAMGFHLAAIAQSFEIGGFTAFNFGQIDIEDVPSSFSTGAYAGIEEDSPWRATAADRIETLRKADLNVLVKSSNGNLIEGAEVTIEMQEHEFGFGSAFVTCRFPGNDCYNQTYIDKVSNLDGLGHGFNVGVTENALKWDGWEEEWIGSPDETVAAVKYLSDNGIKMRGHTMFWPGFGNMPDDISQNRNDLNYIRNRIATRIDEMINDPILGEVITDWDVLNEITTNRDLEASFKNDPNFTSGREIYQEIIRDVKAQNPDMELYINDYIVLSGGGSGSNVVNRYKEFLDELHASENGFDGIGFQCHIGSNPTSILKLESVWDEFYERYGKKLAVTEYDISDLVDPEVQGQYMADILTMTFSHPAMEAFIMWGFWDGNHWKNNAPMFDMQWNLKPGGQAFIDKVFNDWWTNESATSNSEGIAAFRGFKGKYKITTTIGGNTQEMEVDLGTDSDIEFVFENTTSAEDINENEIEIFPTVIAEGWTQVKSADGLDTFEIYNLSGQKVFVQNKLSSDQKIRFALPAGTYLAKMTRDGEIFSRKIIIQ